MKNLKFLKNVYYNLSKKVRLAFINLIKFYQKHISPKKPPVCRFVPTCSNYAIEAIERFGVIKGVAIFVVRIARCNPLFKGGYDPVPEKKNKRNLIL